MVEDKGCFLRHNFWRIKGSIRLWGLKRDIVAGRQEKAIRKIRNELMCEQRLEKYALSFTFVKKSSSQPSSDVLIRRTQYKDLTFFDVSGSQLYRETYVPVYLPCKTSPGRRMVNFCWPTSINDGSALRSSERNQIASSHKLSNTSGIVTAQLMIPINKCNSKHIATKVNYSRDLTIYLSRNCIQNQQAVKCTVT